MIPWRQQRKLWTNTNKQDFELHYSIPTNQTEDSTKFQKHSKLFLSIQIEVYECNRCSRMSWEGCTFLFPTLHYTNLKRRLTEGCVYMMAIRFQAAELGIEWFE